MISYRHQCSLLKNKNEHSKANCPEISPADLQEVFIYSVVYPLSNMQIHPYMKTPTLTVQLFELNPTLRQDLVA